MTAANLIRGAVPRRLKRAVKRLLGRPETRLHPDWELLRRIGPVSDRHLVLDVGAHHGWFFHCWRDWCPRAVVHAFEPTPASFQRCRELYGGQPDTLLVQAAVGARAGTAQLRLLADSDVSNSLLAPDSAAWEAIDYRTGEVTELAVPVITLDDYAAAQSIRSVYLLKIDVQGAELDVLAGAERILPWVDHVFIESGIRPLYQGGARFSQVFEVLTARGFDLIGMRAWHRGNHALVEVDMLFRRAELTGPIDPKVDRIYESS